MFGGEIDVIWSEPEKRPVWFGWGGWREALMYASPKTACLDNIYYKLRSNSAWLIALGIYWKIETTSQLSYQKEILYSHSLFLPFCHIGVPWAFDPILNRTIKSRSKTLRITLNNYSQICSKKTKPNNLQTCSSLTRGAVWHRSTPMVENRLVCCWVSCDNMMHSSRTRQGP